MALYGPADAVAQSPVDQPVIILTHVDRTYSAPGAVPAAVRINPPAQSRLRMGETVQKLVKRLYNVAPANEPSLFGAIVGQVEELNHFAPAASPPPGATILVPDIPKRAAGSRDVGTSRFALSIDPRSIEDVLSNVRINADQLAHQALSAASAWVWSVRTMLPADARSVIEQDPTAQIISAPISIHFSSTTVAARPDTGIEYGDDSRIRSAAAKATLQHPTLFVFDATWPDHQEEEWARSRILDGVRRLRAKAGLPAMRPYDQKCGLNIPHAWTSTANADHTAEIKRALDPYVGLAATAAPVDIIYVPLLMGAPCTDEVLGQMIELDLILREKSNTQSSAGDGDLEKFARTYAQLIVKRIGPAGPDPSEGSTDLGVIQAFLDFSYRYGNLIGQPVFTSMSFDFKLDTFEPAIPSEYGGMFVVAAGNDGTTDSGHVLPPLSETKKQFGARAIHPGDMLAVMNFDSPKDQVCQSTLVTDSGSAFAVAYPGAIDASNCGTSYSAPRVAWLLALREATHPPRSDRTVIGDELRSQLRDGLGQSLAATQGRLLSIKALFPDPVPVKPNPGVAAPAPAPVG